MRSVMQIICIVFFCVVSVFIITAAADDVGPAVSPAATETGTEEKYFDPDLESILAVNDRADYEFLSRLTPEEQRELARMIKKRVDDESGVVVSIMAVVSGFVPAIISAPFAEKMEPATVARISDKVSVKKAVAIAGHLDPEFMARVAVYQDPRKVTAVVEGLEDKQLIEVTRILFSREEYRVVAKFSDNLSTEKLKNVAEKINEPGTLIEIARYMDNRQKVADTAVALSDDYLVKLMGLISSDEDYKMAADIGRQLSADRQLKMLNRLEPETLARVAKYYPDEYLLFFMSLISNGDDYEMAAAIGRQLEVERQVKMLNRLEPEQAARLACHYPAETIALIMGEVDDKKLVDIGRRLSPEAMGHVSVALQPQDLNRFLKLISREQILAALPHVDLARLQGAWPELTPETRDILRDIGKSYPPLAKVISSIK